MLSSAQLSTFFFAHALQAQKKFTELSNEIEELRVEFNDLETQSEQAKGKAQEAWNRGAQFEHIVESLKFGRQKRDWLEKQLNEIARDLKERPESDEWLQGEFDQYEQRVEMHEEHKQQQTECYERLRRLIEQSRDQLQIKHSEAGKYEQQKANYEQELENRKLLVKQSAKSFNIRGFETDLDPTKIDGFMQRISKMHEDQTATIERARQEYERESQELQDMLNRLGERRSSLQEARNSAKGQVAANDRKIVSLQSELGSIEIDEGSKALLDSDIKEVEARLFRAKDDFKGASWDRKIQEANARMRSIEDEKEGTNRDLIERTKQSEEFARLDHLKKELADRERGLATLNSAHNDRLKTLIGRSWRLDSLETEFQTVLEQRSQVLKDSKRQQEAMSRELEQIEFRLASSKSDHNNSQKELELCTRAITDATEHAPENYLKDLEEAQSDRDNLKADVDDYAITRKLYRKSIKTAQGKGKCELCSRHFDGNTQRSEFIGRMEKKIEENTLKEYESQLEQAEQDLQKIRAAGSSHSIWSRLSSVELPRLSSNIKSLESSRNTLIRQMEEQDKQVVDHEESRRDVEALAKPVSSIVKFAMDIKGFAAQIKDLTAKYEESGLPSTTIEDINGKLEALNGASREIRASLSKMTTEKERAQAQINSYDLKLRELKNDLNVANHQLEKKNIVQVQIEELRSANRESRKSIERLDGQMQDLAPQVSEFELKLKDVRQRNSQKENELQQEATRLLDSVHRLRLADQNVQAYLDSGSSSRLARCGREIESMRREIEEKENEQKQIVLEINRINDELRNHKETKRMIGENIKFRQNQRALDAVKKEVADLSAQNAEADLEHHKKQHEHWQNEYNVHSTQKTSKLATMKAKDDQLQQLLRDWETDYKDAARKYKEAHIKVEVSNQTSDLRS